MRIFIASGDKSFRLALLLLLESEPGLVVTGMFDRREDLLTVVQRLASRGGRARRRTRQETTSQLVSDMRGLDFHPRVIVLSSSPKTAAATLAAGADGVISKTAPPDELLPLLRSMRLADAPVDARGRREPASHTTHPKQQSRRRLRVDERRASARFDPGHHSLRMPGVLRAPGEKICVERSQL